MRYGNPSIKSKLNKLKDLGCENIIILPLYPQYAAATTATVCDEVYRSLMSMRWQPSLQVVPHYESEPFYINALVKALKIKLLHLIGNLINYFILSRNSKNILIKEIHTIAIVIKPQG